MKDSFRLSMDVIESQTKINFGDSILFLGSCFSEEIGNQAILSGLDATSNVFGTIFHPRPLGQLLLDAIHSEKEVEFLKSDDLFFHWGSSGKIYALTLNDLKKRILIEREALKDKLGNAKFLFITFGSAFAYRHLESAKLVANCHKQAGNIFQKELSDFKDLVDFWQGIIRDLINFNSNLQIVFTVSPVRHLKDGYVENNLSKACLIQVIAELTKNQNCSYFPAYELVMDDLRDYRFYKKDLIHPNELAIDYVWNFFCKTYLPKEIVDVCEQVKQLKLGRNHVPLYPESKKVLENKIILDQKEKKLSVNHPTIKW
jgi:hypothetical protein